MIKSVKEMLRHLCEVQKLYTKESTPPNNPNGTETNVNNNTTDSTTDSTNNTTSSSNHNHENNNTASEITNDSSSSNNHNNNENDYDNRENEDDKDDDDTTSEITSNTSNNKENKTTTEENKITTTEIASNTDHKNDDDENNNDNNSSEITSNTSGNNNNNNNSSEITSNTSGNNNNSSSSTDTTINNNNNNNNNSSSTDTTINASSNNNNNSSSSCCFCFSNSSCCFCFSSSSNKNNIGGESNNNNSGGESNNGNRPNSEEEKRIAKLRNDLNYILHALTLLTTLEDDVGKSILGLDSNMKNLSEELKEAADDERKRILLKLAKNVVRLKLMIPSPHSMASGADNRRNLQDNGGFSSHNDKSWKFLDPSSQAIKGLEKDYMSLDNRSKLCLLCFALFPENVVVKKRLLIYWWVGEVLLESDGEKTAEEKGREILQELVGKGFIQPVYTMRGREMDSFRMHPLIRSVVIRRAKDVGFFAFDENWNLTGKVSSACKLCLVEKYRKAEKDRKAREAAEQSKRKAKSVDKEAKKKEEKERKEAKKKEDEKERKEAEKVHTLFNFDEQFPDFTLAEFSRMKNLNVLYLGKWESKMNRHIEVEDTEFLNGSKFMKFLRFISLQGMSHVRELPEPICRLPNLRILDLRACHNLEVLPKCISSLKKLTHLDVSECYLLNYMPKGLSSLKELQVLKGFVVCHPKHAGSCGIEELKELKKLRKLSIYAGIDAFPRQGELHAFGNFEKLQKLKITWGGRAFTAQPKADTNASAAPQTNSNSNVDNGQQNHSAETATKRFPSTLEKLDLQCFPRATPPKWLKSSNMKNLTKLYIRGGKLKNLNRKANGVDKWENVEVLRLKYLDQFTLKWHELQESFPKLECLEKVACPKLALYPCNENGVWIKESIDGEEKM